MEETSIRLLILLSKIWICTLNYLFIDFTDMLLAALSFGRSKVASLQFNIQGNRQFTSNQIFLKVVCAWIVFTIVKQNPTVCRALSRYSELTRTHNVIFCGVKSPIHIAWSFMVRCYRIKSCNNSEMNY